MSVLGFYTRSPITQIKFIFPNWYGVSGGGGETAPGSTATITASVEYPPGTCTPLTFSSASSATITNGGQVTSDYVTIPGGIPTNTLAKIREYLLNSSGIVVNNFLQPTAGMGDALIVGNSGVVDQTVSCGTVTDGGNFQTIAPLAIIAPITAAAVCGYGDSIMIGVNNTHQPNSAGDSGEVMPSIGPSFGYSNMGVNGETASSFVSTHTNRAAVLPYCSHEVVEYGTNDLYLNGESAATLEGNLTTIYGYGAASLVSPKTVFQTTLIARTTSNDSWATTSGQLYVITPYAGEVPRVTFNSDLTSAAFGPNGGYFAPDPVVGTSTNNGFWKSVGAGLACSGGAWTQDGTHPNDCGYYTGLQSSGFINTSRIHRP